MRRKNLRTFKSVLGSDKEYYSFFSDNSAVMLLIDPSNGNIIDANEAAGNFYGYSHKELISMKIQDINTLSEEQLATEIERVEKKEQSHFLFEHRLANGSIKNVEVYSGKIILKDKPLLFSIIHDITERKQAELMLKLSEERLREVSNDVWVWEVDNKGVYTYTSHTGIDYFGFSSEDIIGKTPFDFMPPEEATRVAAIFSEIIASKAPIIDLENWNIKENKEMVCLLTNGVPILDIEGNLKGYRGMDKDITRRKQAELALKESERLLIQLNADKDRFISILSHDLRTPFNALIGLSGILKEDFHKLNIDEIKDIANQINNSAINTYSMLEEILMWARVQQGKFPFNPRKLSFDDICEKVLRSLYENASAKNITINYLSRDRHYVFADHDMLQTVVRNLVSNAIKFTDNYGVINIKAEEKFGILTISVSDNGIGIEPDDLAKLFDLSHVVSTKGTAEETGTGLGLMLCKEIVEKLGGKIWVVSEYGKGSDFKFTLPIFPEEKGKNDFS